MEPDNCVGRAGTPPPGVPNSAVSYTYDATTNSGEIAFAGTYPDAATVGCGQGDIYATFTKPGVATPNLGILNGSSDPYQEHFLHQMGFSGPWTHTSTTATASNTTCGAGGSYTLADTEGVVWFVDGSTTPTAPGTYSVTGPTTVNIAAEAASSDYGGELDAQTAWTFDFTDPVDCLPTPAYTGSDGANLGLLLARGFLLFGGTSVAFERRFRSSTR